MSEDYKSKVTSLGTQMNKTYTEYEDIDEQIKSVRKTIKLYKKITLWILDDKLGKYFSIF